MILYNVTISIDENVEQKWLQWMKNTHIPDVMKTNCFIECKLSKINGEEEGGKSTQLARSPRVKIGVE